MSDLAQVSNVKKLLIIQVGILEIYMFPKLHILDCSKRKEFADDNFRFDENGRKLSKQVENT